MKNKILLFGSFILCFVLNTSAQKKDAAHYQKIITLKVNFISSELNLSPETAEKFWPVYNYHEKINRELRSTKIKNIKKDIDEHPSIESISDEEATELSNRILDISKQHHDNKTELFDKLKPILTPQQLLKLHFTEMEFNKKVLRKLHHDREKK